MRWGKLFKTLLDGKFLLSYLLIVLVGVETLLVVTFALAPVLFQAQLMPPSSRHILPPCRPLRRASTSWGTSL